MGEEKQEFSQKLLSFLEIIAKEGVTNAARGLGIMMGGDLTVTQPEVHIEKWARVPDLLGGPENEAVGIYLRTEGDLNTQIMLIMPWLQALELVDLLMDVPIGTTQTLGRLERSALAEVGNLTGTFFLNSVAALTGLSARPTPPAVMVDMVGAILDIIIATIGGIGEHVLLLQTIFVYKDRQVETNFWVIPDTATLEAIAARI